MLVSFVSPKQVMIVIKFMKKKITNIIYDIYVCDFFFFNGDNNNNNNDDDRIILALKEWSEEIKNSNKPRGFYCFVWAFPLNKFKTILKRTDIIVIKVFLNFINIYLKPQSFYFIFFLKPFLNICWKSIFKTLENSFNNCSFIL